MVTIEDNNNFSKMVYNIYNKLTQYKRDNKRIKEMFPLENEGLETIKLFDAIKLIDELDTDICKRCKCKMLFYDYDPYCMYQFSLRRIDKKKIHTPDNLIIICWSCSSHDGCKICSRCCHKKDEIMLK